MIWRNRMSANEIQELGIAMSMLKNYGYENKCSCWLQYQYNGMWHTRICHYGVYDGGVRNESPIKSVTEAIVCAKFASLSLEKSKIKS